MKRKKSIGIIKHINKLHKYNDFYNRLFFYRKALQQMLENGKFYTSSRELALLVSNTSAMVRQDLGLAGSKGKPGKVSSIKMLIYLLDKAFKKNIQLNYIFIGNNELSNLLFKNFLEYKQDGTIHCFITNKNEIVEYTQSILQSENYRNKDIQQNIQKLVIHDYEDFFNPSFNDKFDVAMISSDYQNTNKIFNKLKQIDIKAVLNYSEYYIYKNMGIYIENIDFKTHLPFITNYVKYANYYY